ncbi:hypothetical protein KJN74_04295 [Candidatus Bathyarchaeota archaeon]|nr:hypothetical protein [Candidatus Bathyarchaeota archaeon]
MAEIVFIERQIISLGLMEKELYELYSNLAEKTTDLVAKSLFTYIATDSLKHSQVFVTILEEAGGSNLKIQDCNEAIRYNIDLIKTLAQDISKTKPIGREYLLSLIDTLAGFENLLYNEYSKAFHFETNQYNKKDEIKNPESDLNVFRLIVNDEDLHKQILLSIVNNCDKKLDFKDNTPFVKYQRPDSWYVPPR